MLYSKSHEWVLKKGPIATIGISDHAQRELGHIVYAQLPEVREKIVAKEIAVILESTKLASEIYAPISGKIIAINELLLKNPEIINLSPEDKGWLFTVEIADPEELKRLQSHTEYLASLKS